jgi:hypothetical protein
MRDAMEFVIDQAEKWKRLNEQKRAEYEQEKSPSVVVKFIKEYPQALQEPWVNKVVAGWLLEGRKDVLKPVISLGKGENADAYERNLENLMIVDRIESMWAKEGITLTRAFQLISEAETPLIHRKLGFSTIKNIYYDTKKSKPKIVCREESDCFVLEVSPTRIMVEGHKMYGRWEYKIPK